MNTLVKRINTTGLFIMLLAMVEAQPTIDSLEQQLALSKADTNRVTLLSDLSIRYTQSDISISMKYATEGLALARQLKFKSGEADCLRRTGIIYFVQGRYPEALDLYQQALIISQNINHSFGIGAGLGHIGNIYAQQGDHARARSYYFRYLEIAQNSHTKSEEANALKRIGESYLEDNLVDSASEVIDRTYKLLDGMDDKRIMGGILKDMGQVQLKKGNQKQAVLFFHRGIAEAMAGNNRNVLAEIYIDLAWVYQVTDQIDSCIYYGKEALTAGQKNNFAKVILASSRILADAFEPTDARESLKYHKMATALNDSLFNSEKASQVQNLFFLEHQRQQAVEREHTKHKNQLRLYALFAVLFVFLLVALILYRNNRTKQKANELLNRQKEEIQEQRHQAEQALKELKATQSQLIQSEKMASLGELTAGIAHEIQNPLNFVNNFSEVNKELLTEMKDEIDKGNLNEVKTIANDVIENQEKINQHGKRADSIVKGMLQHSRTSSGQKEQTDINALADEYLRLAYHGLRAKNKTFNAKLETDFDSSIEKINIVPPEIGRAILNLVNNAFYAASPPSKGGISEPVSNKIPTVWVSTRKEKNNVLITVRDNGPGIPSNILDKIFQPFFTTKPTGKGTGLGLSLAYDIVKAHGGELKVKTKEGEGSEFIIQLPLKQIS